MADSSEEEEEGGVFDINAIRAERWNAQARCWEFLIEWDGYGMHKSTFEPETSLDHLPLLLKWKSRKSRLTQKLFQSFNKQNVARYDIAYAKYQEHKQHRKRLNQRKRRKRHVVEDDSEDDNAVPGQHKGDAESVVGQETRFKYFLDIRDTLKLGSLPSPTYVSLDYVGPSIHYDSDTSDDDENLLVHKRRDPQSQVKQTETGPTTSQELYEDLFVGSQDTSPLDPPTPIQQPNDGLSVGPRAVPRAAPFDQSDEEDNSATHTSSESSDDEPLITKAKTNPQTKSRHDLGNSILSPDIAKSSISRQQSNTVLEKHKSKGSGQVTIPPQSSHAHAITGNSLIGDKGTNMSPKVRRPSGSSPQVSSTTTVNNGSVARQQFSATSDPASSVASLSKPAPAGSSSRPMAQRTGTSLKPPNAIRMTNNPEAPKRKEWDTDNHFKTLKFRHKAQIRGSNEANPDVNALDFVGAAPSNLSKTNVTAPADNVYGRREVRTRRVEEDSDEDRLRHRSAPMADWEASKVPLVCYHWRLSNSCPNPPSKCVFLHRNKDENGFDLPIGDEYGYVPPKYRKPPVTCLFWLEDPNGCSKPDRECAFTHRNTGFKLLEGTKGETVPIDPSLPPINERAVSGFQSPHQQISTPITKPSGNGHMRTKNLTCHWWLQGSRGCNFTEAECRFAHTNTGWALEEGVKGKPVQINPNLMPVTERAASEHTPSNYSIPTPISEQSASGFLEKKDLTCRYWLEARKGCTKSDAECKFAHRNTGWTLQNGARVQIDPALLPSSERFARSNEAPAHPTLSPVNDPPHIFHLPVKSLTCRQWLESSTGCKHSDSECEFAHRNTGWKQGDTTGKPTQINPALLPKRRASGNVLPKHRECPLTCHWWLEGPTGCHKSDADCIYAHRNTGWRLKEGFNGERIQIDPTIAPATSKRDKVPIVPRSNTHDYRNRTCWFWANDRCLKSDDQCLFKHRITDVLAGRNSSESSLPICIPYLTDTCGSESTCGKAHIDLARLKHEARREARSTDEGNPNLIPVMQRDDSRDVQEENIQQDSSDHHDFMANGKVPVTASPVEERLPPLPHADRAQELSRPRPNAAVPQQSISTDLETNHSQARLLSLAIKNEVEGALKVSFTSLFEWSDDVMLDRRAILLFHPVDHHEELELLTRWLLMHHVEVSSAWFPGAWHYHSEHIITGGSGIIIAHPSFEQFLDLANFGQMLRKQVRLWSLGTQTNIEHDPAALNCPSDTRLDCIEIFPVGGLIYITEDVFEEMPQLALQIIRLFCAKIDNIHKLSGSKSLWQELQEVNLHWRLCVRPELMEYLFQRCEEQEKALEAGDANILACAELYTLLSDGRLIEQDTPVRPLESKCDSFPIMSERRVVAEGQPLDYFEALARSREEATARMVQYYGCVHLDMRRDYRHFYVVHIDPRAPCATRWKDKNHALTDVITPEQCILELSKGGLGAESSSTFDFYERYFLDSNKESIEDSTTKTSTEGRKGSSTLGDLVSRG